LTNAVSGVGLTPGSIAISPAALDFGSLTTGTTAQASFVVTNSGGTAVSNGTATVTGGPYTILSGATFDLPAFSAIDVVVRFAPVSTGGFTNTVVFATANGGNATNTVNGTGTLPSTLNNFFTVGDIVTNQLKLFDLDGVDVTALASNTAVVKILFSLRDQISPTSTTLISNVVATVATKGRGISGSVVSPSGTMKYIPVGNYFAFDANTAGWDANTVGNSHYYRATVTVTPKTGCTKVTVGTGAVRLESR
jgi:hypothetical protein